MFKSKWEKLIIVLVIAISPIIISWGVWGHEHINRAAVLAQPEPLLTFFYNHIDYLTTESSVPDLRKYTLHDKAEFPRHFIDLENYGTIDSLPFDYKEAVDKYGQDFMNKNGIVFWYIKICEDKLTQAFKKGRPNEILFLAADLGHYIGDSHMPFHTTINYNGQLTGQKGIHALWESEIPEKLGHNYNFYIGQAEYIDNVQDEIYKIIKHSHSLVDTALMAYKKAQEEMGNKNIFVLSEDGKPKRNMFGAYIYSDEFIDKFNKNMNGMVEKQLRSAIKETANFWYTAWVNAGKPDLSKLNSEMLTKSNKKMLKKEHKWYMQGKLPLVTSFLEF